MEVYMDVAQEEVLQPGRALKFFQWRAFDNVGSMGSSTQSLVKTICVSQEKAIQKADRLREQSQVADEAVKTFRQWQPDQRRKNALEYFRQLDLVSTSTDEGHLPQRVDVFWNDVLHENDSNAFDESLQIDYSKKKSLPAKRKKFRKKYCDRDGNGLSVPESKASRKTNITKAKRKVGKGRKNAKTNKQKTSVGGGLKKSKAHPQSTIASTSGVSQSKTTNSIGPPRGCLRERNSYVLDNTIETSQESSEEENCSTDPNFDTVSFKGRQGKSLSAAAKPKRSLVTGAKLFSASLQKTAGKFKRKYKSGLFPIQQGQKAKVRELVKHTCDKCGKTFYKRAYLRLHWKTHSGVKAFACQICGLRLSRNCDLQRHLDIHAGVKNYKCQDCGKAFHASNDLSRHIRIHQNVKPFKCSVCGLAFKQEVNLKSHQQTHLGKDKNKFRCTTCGESFTRKSNLKRHVQSKHNKESAPQHACEACGRAFTRLSDLDRHKRTHTGDRPFQCELCGLSFYQAAHLKAHSRRHEFRKNLIDAKADELGLESSESLQIYRKLSKKPKPEKGKQKVAERKLPETTKKVSLSAEDVSEVRSRKCSLCCRRFSTVYKCDRHVKWHFTKNDYTCSNCAWVPWLMHGVSFSGNLCYKLRPRVDLTMVPNQIQCRGKKMYIWQ